MPVFDTPITTDDNNLKKVLGQKQPAVLVLMDGQKKDAPLEETMQREAKKHAGELLVVKVDARANPDTLAQYGNLSIPALVTLTPAMFGHKIKSKAENIRAADLRAHIEHLLTDKPLPEPKPTAQSQTPKGKGIMTVTDATFKRDVLNSNVPVLVDFWATWCGPCHMIAPHVEKIAQQYGGKMKVAKLDVDANRATTIAYGVQAMPTFILFVNGKPAQRFSGANPSAIEQMVRSVIK